MPGESTLRRDFQRLQQENKERSEAHKRQQGQLAAQRRDPEEHKRQLLHDRQKRIEEQKEQRRRLEEVINLNAVTAAFFTFEIKIFAQIRPHQVQIYRQGSWFYLNLMLKPQLHLDSHKPCCYFCHQSTEIRLAEGSSKKTSFFSLTEL